MEIIKCTCKDIDEMSNLFDKLNAYLEKHINYPCWKKDLYPIREDAVEGILHGTAFAALINGKIAGTVLLKIPDENYFSVFPFGNLTINEVLAVGTLAVHPEFLHKGTGSKIMNYVIAYARKNNFKALCLDVCNINAPAIGLYEALGFRCVGTADFGYSTYGENKSLLFQMLL